MDYIAPIPIPIPKKPYIKKYDNKTNKRVCCVNGCNNPHKARGLCNTHYCVILRREKGQSPQKPFKPSKIIPFHKEKIATIELLNIKGAVVARAIIDIEDIKKVSKYRWSLKRQAVQGYSKGMSKKKRVYLHRVIMQPKPHLVVDHINHNTLDNRKSNLRVCTHHQNIMNVKSRNRSNNTTGYKGVRRRGLNNWIARIQIDHKEKYLGSFSTKEKAAAEYNKAATKYFGEFACLNKVSMEVQHDK